MLPVRIIHRSVAAAEAPLEVGLDRWHDYSLQWNTDGVKFEVDGELILETPIQPHAPLGFVAWIDNQYAVLSEQRGLRFGMLSTEREVSLELADLRLEGG
jgi:hypothetical protein